MPLSLLVNRLVDVPQTVQEAVSTLSFRNTILVYLNVEQMDLFPDQWIYIQSPEFKYMVFPFVVSINSIFGS